MKFLLTVPFAVLLVFIASPAVHAQEPTASPTGPPSSTAVAQPPPTATVAPPAEEAPLEPTNVRLFILGSYARLEWEFAPAANEGPPEGFELRIVVDGQPGPTFTVGGDARAFDFPPEHLPRCGGPRMTFGVAAFVTAGRSAFVEETIDFGTDCDVSTDDEIVASPVPGAVRPPDAGSGMRNEDWTAIMAISSIALAGLVCIALGMSVDDTNPRRR
jgi:hypothetical protein